MHFDLIENISFDDVLKFLVSAIMLAAIAFCITLRRLVMNCLCKHIKLRGCVGRESE